MPSPTPQQRRDARKAERQEQMDKDIAEGRLTVRQMTPAEKKKSDADKKAGDEQRAKRKRRR